LGDHVPGEESVKKLENPRKGVPSLKGRGEEAIRFAPGYEKIS